MHARATAELSAYERLHSVCNLNKAVSALVPLVGISAYCHIWKAKPKDTSKHTKAIAGVTALALLTNIYAAYSRSQIAPTEDRLIEKYVYTLDDKTLNNYALGGRKFPNAK